MHPLAATETAKIQDAVEGAMLDTCQVLVYTETPGDLNEPAITYVPGPVTICRFEGKKQLFEPSEDYGIASANGLVKLPTSVPITSRDHILLLTRFGYALDPPQEYDVKGEPAAGVWATDISVMDHHL